MSMIDCDVLLAMLDAAQLRQAAIANNLANLDTPGYRTVRVRFARQLDEMLDEQGRLRPGRSLTAETYRPLFGDVGADGNDVVLEREIAEMHKNMLRTRLYLEALHARVRRLRSAIDGR